MVNDDLCIREVCLLLRKSRRMIYNYLKDGKLAGYKMGRDWFITENSIKDFIMRSNFKGGSQND